MNLSANNQRRAADLITRSILIFSVTLLLLACLSTYLYFQRPTLSAAVPEKMTPSVEEPSPKPAPEAEKPEPPPNPEPPFEWEPIESADYKTYIANLRKLGFPEELVQAVIIADIDKLYAPREAPFRFDQVPYDGSLADRRRRPTVEEIEQFKQLREVQIEKQKVLQELLGIRVPREMIRTPNSRNYEGYEYAISQLPPEKQDAVQYIQENEFLQDDLNGNQTWEGRGELQAYRQVNVERDNALKAILTPEEFNLYMMNSTPPGTELARRTIGMEPTPEEMLAMWKISEEQWKAQGGVYGRWRADPVPHEEIIASDQRVEEQMQAALGDDRYLDYQMAIHETGQQMRNFANRYNLPRETMAEAFRLQRELDTFLNTHRTSDLSALHPRAAQLAEQLQSTLGPDLFNSWQNGRSQDYNLQP